MAPKKQVPAGKAAPSKGAARKSPAVKSAPRKKNLVVIKGYEAWGEWLEGLASRKGMPVTVLIDQALRDVAKREGYPDPPARY